MSQSPHLNSPQPPNLLISVWNGLESGTSLSKIGSSTEQRKLDIRFLCLCRADELKG